MDHRTGRIPSQTRPLVNPLWDKMKLANGERLPNSGIDSAEVLSFYITLEWHRECSKMSHSTMNRSRAFDEQKT